VGCNTGESSGASVVTGATVGAGGEAMSRLLYTQKPEYGPWSSRVLA
jgi:hypothetical protein